MLLTKDIESKLIQKNLFFKLEIINKSFSLQEQEEQKQLQYC